MKETKSAKVDQIFESCVVCGNWRRRSYASFENFHHRKRSTCELTSDQLLSLDDPNVRGCNSNCLGPVAWNVPSVDQLNKSVQSKTDSIGAVSLGYKFGNLMT